MDGDCKDYAKVCEAGACVKKGCATCVATKGCVFTQAPEECTDGNVCTASDNCTGGTCVPGTYQNCEDGKPCTVVLDVN